MKVAINRVRKKSHEKWSKPLSAKTPFGGAPKAKQLGPNPIAVPLCSRSRGLKLLAPRSYLQRTLLDGLPQLLDASRSKQP